MVHFFAKVTPRMADALPKDFGRYQLERRLGVGGMAETFVARRLDTQVERRVCLKRVLPAFNEDPVFREQFQREARLAAKLRHTNIVTTLDFGAVESVQFMALELVEGTDLREVLRACHKLPFSIACQVAFDVTHALEYAHRPEGEFGGIVHRDVTPSNVLISRRGEVKLADFGVAKSLGGTTALTQTGMMKGKMPYMAPEQMRGADIDGRVDIFALGVLLYESIAGVRPFTGQHEVEIMTKIVSGDHPPLRQHAPGAPAALERLVHSMIDSNRDTRIQSAEALIGALAPFVPPAAQRDELGAFVLRAVDAKADRNEQYAADAPTELSPNPIAKPTSKPTMPQGHVNAEDVRRASQPAERSKPTVMGIGGPAHEPEKRVREDAKAVANTGADIGQHAETTDEFSQLAPITGPTMQIRQERPKSRTGVYILAAVLLLVVGVGMGLFLRTLASDDEVAVNAEDSAEGQSAADESAELAQDDTAENESDESESDDTDAPRDSGDESSENGEDAQAGEAEASEAAESGRTSANAATDTPANAATNAPTNTAVPNMREGTSGSSSTQTSESNDTSDSAPRVPLRITVIPWGQVWLNGQPLGRAPVTRRLPPGRYRISAGPDSPLVHRSVRLRDRPQRITIDLDAELDD